MYIPVWVVVLVAVCVIIYRYRDFVAREEGQNRTEEREAARDEVAERNADLDARIASLRRYDANDDESV